MVKTDSILEYFKEDAEYEMNYGVWNEKGMNMGYKKKV